MASAAEGTWGFSQRGPFVLTVPVRCCYGLAAWCGLAPACLAAGNPHDTQSLAASAPACTRMGQHVMRRHVMATSLAAVSGPSEPVDEHIMVLPDDFLSVAVTGEPGQELKSMHACRVEYLYGDVWVTLRVMSQAWLIACSQRQV